MNRPQIYAPDRGGPLPQRPGQSARFAAGLFIAIALLVAAKTASAATNLVQNPYFTQSSAVGTSISASEQFGTYSSGGGTYTPGQLLANWSSTGYSFVFLNASTNAANDTYGSANLSLDTAVTAYNPANPAFLGADGNTGVGAIVQTITGLTPGQLVAVSFAWAGAEQTGFSCGTGCTSYWTVDLGSAPAQTTTAAPYPTQGFTGWITQTFYFMPTSTSEVLSFLAGGTPASGAPPFALLTNVSVTAAPEPASVTIVISGIAGLMTLARRRTHRTTSPIA